MTADPLSGAPTVPPPHQAVVDAVCAALRPHRWRSLRPELLARLVLAAVDRQQVQELLATVPGASAGSWDELDPVAPSDGRVEAVVSLLRSRRWTGLTLEALGAQVVACHRGL